MGGSFDLDLCDHYLLITAYSCVVSELLKLLEELVTVFVVYLSELLPLGALDLFISVLPKPVS